MQYSGGKFPGEGILYWEGAIFRGSYTGGQFSKRQLSGVQSSRAQFSRGKFCGHRPMISGKLVTYAEV